MATSIKKEMAQNEGFAVQIPSYGQADEEDTPFGSIHGTRNTKPMDLSSSTEDVTGFTHTCAPIACAHACANTHARMHVPHRTLTRAQTGGEEKWEHGGKEGRKPSRDCRVWHLSTHVGIRNHAGSLQSHGGTMTVYKPRF